MAHLLIVELPGGNDFDLLHAAQERGHSFSFLSWDLNLYEETPVIQAWVDQARHKIDAKGQAFDAVEERIKALHAIAPFDAILCLLDIRLIETAKLASALGLRYLNPESAVLLRDKFNVRCRLLQAGLRQPAFALATSNEEARQAVAQVGLPVLIKPADGYGSQNILSLRGEAELEWLQPFARLLPSRTDYGLGVMANDRLLVEGFMQGQLVGCDTFSLNGQHRMLGVNRKLMFDPPAFAIRGGCFEPYGPQFEALQQYVFAALDAVGFDCGASHTEVMLTVEGPQLVEINARLVGAKMPRLMSLALQRSVHADLIELHLGQLDLQDWVAPTTPRVAVSRWLVAAGQAQLESVELPDWQDERIGVVEIVKQPGDWIRPPFENADRIGCVMVRGADEPEASALAERFIQDTRLRLRVPTAVEFSQEKLAC